MRRRTTAAAVGAAIFAVTMLVAAAPAIADGAPGLTQTTAMWVVVLGGLGVVIVGGSSFQAPRRASKRRHEQKACERGRQEASGE
jgi:uncharacterized membrane protein YccC